MLLCCYTTCVKYYCFLILLSIVKCLQGNVHHFVPLYPQFCLYDTVNLKIY